MKFKHKIKRSFALSIALSVLICGIPVHASDIVPEQNIAAQWVKNAVKITFDSNDGGVAPNTQVYTYGVERSLPGACAMKKEGYIFKGWAETASATTAKSEPGATSATAFGYADADQAIAKTLYAVWGAESNAPSDNVNDTKLIKLAWILNESIVNNESLYNRYNRPESYTSFDDYYTNNIDYISKHTKEISGSIKSQDPRDVGQDTWFDLYTYTGSGKFVSCNMDFDPGTDADKIGIRVVADDQVVDYFTLTRCCYNGYIDYAAEEIDYEFPTRGGVDQTFTRDINSEKNEYAVNKSYSDGLVKTRLGLGIYFKNNFKIEANYISYNSSKIPRFDNGTVTLIATLDYLPEYKGGSIRSIQRGSITCNNNSSTENSVSATITKIDPKKSFVILDPMPYNISNACGCKLTGLYSDKLTITNKNCISVDYQIIEYN